MSSVCSLLHRASVSLPTRHSLLHDLGVLTVYRKPVPPPVPAPGQPGNRTDYVATEPELFIAMLADGRVLAFNGHVDLGTGIRTSLAQIVAEELDMESDQVTMILGDPRDVPNQGPTIASATIQITSKPLQAAAAQARQFLVNRAASLWDIDPQKLEAHNGIVRSKDNKEQAVSFGELVAGERFDLLLDVQAPLKDDRTYQQVGRSQQRVDIPGKIKGQLTFVHDLRVPDMLHGRVVRPPYTGRDTGDFVGTSLVAVDKTSIVHLPGIIDVVVEGDFVGIVAQREEQAIKAAKQLKIKWKSFPALPAMQSPEQVAQAIRQNPSKNRPLKSTGDIEQAFAQAEQQLRRDYFWSYNMHGSIGPSCSVADVSDGSIKLWSGTQNPHSLRTDISRLTGQTEDTIEIVRMEASGCYGRNCADDVGSDAVLLSRAVGRPVRVQLTREQEHGWEPKGTAQVMSIAGSLQQGRASGYRFNTSYPSNDGTNLALLLTGKVAADAKVFEMGDRTSVPPYSYEAMDISCDDTAPIVRSSWLRGVSALPNNFAHECFIDELAVSANLDPVAFRLSHLEDNSRACGVIKQVADKGGWQPDEPHRGLQTQTEGWLPGRGFAYGHYVHSKFPGFGAAMAAWMVDLEVHPETGDIRVIRVVVGQDAGRIVNPAGVRHQVHGNIIQTLSRTLKERVLFDHEKVASLEWGGYPIFNFTELPEIELILDDHPEHPSLGVGESAALPCAPAIASALFDATGQRFYQAPFTPNVVRCNLK